MTCFRQFVLQLLCVLPALALDAAQDEAPKKPVEFSYGKLEVLSDGGTVLPLLSRVAPVVEVSVGPGQSAHFFLDTGAFAVFLSPDQAALWGLDSRELPTTRIPSATGSITVDRCARLDRLAMGDGTATDVDAILADTFPGIPGIVGVSILSQCPLLLDGRAGKARLLPVDFGEQLLDTLYPDGHWSKLPLRWQDAVPTVVLVAGKRSLQMFIDTGSTSSYLESAAIRDLGLPVVRKEQVRTRDASGEHLKEMEVFALQDMSLGNWSCDLETSPSDNPEMGSVQFDGILGFDFLGRIPCVFDAPHGMLWLLDPPEDEAVLRSTQDSRAIAYFEDPLPGARTFAAISVARTGRRRLVSQVAALLDDSVPEVQAAAAEALSVFAQKTWPTESRLSEARSWWELHKADEEFQLPAESGK